MKPASDILTRMSESPEHRDDLAEPGAGIAAKLEHTLLGSHASANFLIFTLIFLVAMMFVGVGLFATHRINPVNPFAVPGAPPSTPQ